MVDRKRKRILIESQQETKPTNHLNKLNVMKKTVAQISLIVAAATGLVAPANADLLYTFDTGAVGGDGGGFNGGTFAWDAGSQAVKHTGASGGWNLGGSGPKFEFGWPVQTTVATIANGGNGRVSFDISVNASSFALGGWADWDYYQLHFSGNSDGSMGWTQDPPSGANPVDTNYHPATPDGSWHFDFSFAQMGWQPGDGWFQIFFGSNSDGSRPVQFSLDNIRVYETAVPEPGSAALLGLGTTAMLFFRRRKA